MRPLVISYIDPGDTTPFFICLNVLGIVCILYVICSILGRVHFTLNVDGTPFFARRGYRQHHNTAFLHPRGPGTQDLQAFNAVYG